MNKGLLGSVSFHALIIIVALLGLPAMKPFDIAPVEAIQVDISNITGETKVKAQSNSEDKPAEKPKPKISKVKEKTKPVEKVTEEKKAAKEPEKAEPPPPEPEKKKEPEKVEDKPLDSDPLKQLLADDLQKEADAKKLEDKKKKLKEEADIKKKAEADKKLADDKKKLDVEKKKKAKEQAMLQDMIDKSNDEASDTVEQKDTAGTPEKAEKNTQGDDSAMSATIIDGLRQRLSECWTIPPSVKEAQETVELSWEMNQQGEVMGQPVVTGGSGGATARSAAISAVTACQPYDWLPKDRFDLWQSIEWTFAPR